MVPSLLLSFQGLFERWLAVLWDGDAAAADIIIGVSGAKLVFNRCVSPVEHWVVNTGWLCAVSGVRDAVIVP